MSNPISPPARPLKVGIPKIRFALLMKCLAWLKAWNPTSVAESNDSKIWGEKLSSRNICDVGKGMCRKNTTERREFGFVVVKILFFCGDPIVLVYSIDTTSDPTRSEDDEQ